ncbi:unnamed protein product [Discosporangium mesarthrocarpum]
MDELLPLSKRGQDWFGLGLTIIDSMDTLWLAGEREEYTRCLKWVEHELRVDINKNVNVFETTIRVLGGLLSAYHLSGDNALLRKATDLGSRLSSAFSSRSGVPYSDVNLSTRRTFNPGHGVLGLSSLAEATTLQLEFSYLSRVSGDPSFAIKANQASESVEEGRQRLGWSGGPKGGLAPIYISPETGEFGGGDRGEGGRVTLGARGDSYYEYLLKQWMFSGKR